MGHTRLQKCPPNFSSGFSPGWQVLLIACALPSEFIVQPCIVRTNRLPIKTIPQQDYPFIQGSPGHHTTTEMLMNKSSPATTRPAGNMHKPHIRPAVVLQGRPISILRSAAQSEVATSHPELMKEVKAAYDLYQSAPPSQKFEFSADVLSALQKASAGGALKKFGTAMTNVKRRSVFQNELRQVGIKDPGMIAVPSTRNDAAFLLAVVMSTSFLAVIAGAVLPGDWGFFSSYLIGGISLVVLAIGSTNPSLLQFFIDKFSLVFPDYRERVVRHEAAHFLIGYLAGCPVTNYSILIGQERVEFAEQRLQKRLIEKILDDEEIDSLAIVAVAGIAAEAQKYDEVMGQTADLIDLQRILLRSKNKISDAQQQNMTRWAVLTAGGLLRQYKKEHEALIEAMTRGASVWECIQAVEAVPVADN